MTQELLNRATQQASTMHAGEQLQPTLHIRHLQHTYGTGELRKQVLFDNHLDVYEGEIVIMTGPSGSGKTTLLTLVGTLRTVQQGTLRVLDQELCGATPRELGLMRRNIGFIFQAHNLFGSLTALQNVSMGLEQMKLPRAEIKHRASQLLTRLGLGQRLHHKPQSLSGGQKQRVAIARGLAHHPRIVLADEPTAALDEASGREVVTLFQELAREQKTTIVLVTHDNRILDVADRIVNMVDGRIKSDVVVREVALICEFIQKLPAFRGLTPGTLTSIADRMRVERHPAGTEVIRQGDAGEKFYLIRHGEVEILHETRQEQQRIATLREGDCFGEMALLTGTPRRATVRTSQDSVLYALGQDDFHAAVAKSASLREELQKALFERQ